MTYRTASQVINEAEELLQTARFGLEDMQTRPARAKSGLRNVIVFGRAVTFALQNLRSVVPDFDAWYAPHQQAMKDDPVMSYFSELRTKIEKQAISLPVTNRAVIHSFKTKDIIRFYPQPPNATVLIIGDQNGGSGWYVKTERGADVMYYVDLPPDIGHVDIMLMNAPPVHGMANSSATDLARVYLDNIGYLVSNARGRFVNV